MDGGAKYVSVRTWVGRGGHLIDRTDQVPSTCRLQRQPRRCWSRQRRRLQAVSPFECWYPSIVARSCVGDISAPAHNVTRHRFVGGCPPPPTYNQLTFVRSGRVCVRSLCGLEAGGGSRRSFVECSPERSPSPRLSSLLVLFVCEQLHAHKTVASDEPTPCGDRTHRKPNRAWR